MSARVTFERVLRDADDASAQTIRDWKIESVRGHITFRLKHGDGFISLRPDDVYLFIKDLNRAKETALDLFSEAE